ncbi:MAG: DUF512 domain-containing protein [Chloroflexi bacterium]|nr:DUF512 domain-containing protein [Chloroflexota bacterium]
MPLAPFPGLKEAQGGLITSVEPGSIAAELGLRPDDWLLSINGHPMRDVIDYRFYFADALLTLVVERAGETFTVEVEKDEDDLLGVDFGVALFDDIRRCNNGCYFCFVGGLKKGMRRSLFIMDDDYRLSFLFGSFVTLTNLDETDWQRIEEQHLTPLYVSVHATDVELRRKLLVNPTAPDAVEQILRLRKMGIQVHCQLVVCPTVNDNDDLDKSIGDLAALYPTVQSIGVVPVGTSEMGRQRNLRRVAHKQPENPFEAVACTPEVAFNVLDRVHRWQKQFRKEFGESMVYASDEYYLISGTPVPPAARYDGYPQFENGIGMTRSMLDDWKNAKRRWERSRAAGKPAPAMPESMTWVCGLLVEPVLRQVAEEFAALTGVRTELIPVTNQFFGATISASGLLTAADIRAALEGRELGQVVAAPRLAVDDAGERFLDDVSPEELEKSLGREVWFARQPHELLTGRKPALTRGKGVLGPPIPRPLSPNSGGKG